MSLFDEDTAEKGGYFYYEDWNWMNFPDNVSDANTAFNENGLFTNTLNFTLPAAGDITLGIRKTQAKALDWCCFDNFTLRYLGDPTAIRNVTTDGDGTAATYNLSGQRVSKATTPGVYIKGGRKVIKK